jgi:uncharacterized membrane protein
VRLLLIVFLALHLSAALVAYLPTVALPWLLVRPGAEGQIAPRPAWAEILVKRLSLPAMISLPFTGAALVIVAGINPATQFWLWFSILLYVATLAYLIFRQRRRIAGLVAGERSPELIRELRGASLGVLAVIVVIGAMMMLKPGR